jgi:preprotein translocase subunit YajC
MIVAMVGLFFFMQRGDKKKKAKLKEMRDNIAPGDTVTTIGGFVGKVVHVKENTVVFETSEDRVRLEIEKWGIQTIGKLDEEPTK